MKKIFLILIILSVHSKAYLQSVNIDVPSIRPKMEQEYYAKFKKAFIEAKLAIADTNYYWFDLDLHYWNIFWTHATLSSDSISRIYWKKLFKTFPYTACNDINYYFQEERINKISPYQKKHLLRNYTFYDSCCQVYYNSLDSNLIKTLHLIDKDDQFYRNKLVDNLSKHEINKLWNNQIKNDGINLSKIDSIFNIYGYTGRDLVGIKNEKIMFLVIQHSNLKTMEKYLPYIKKEIAEHTLNPKVYAYLKDRINMLKGIPQIFGTQVKEIKSGKFELYKMRSMNNIDKLRASFNLGSLSKYLEGYGIKIEKQ